MLGHSSKPPKSFIFDQRSRPMRSLLQTDEAACQNCSQNHFFNLLDLILILSSPHIKWSERTWEERRGGKTNWLACANQWWVLVPKNWLSLVFVFHQHLFHNIPGHIELTIRVHWSQRRASIDWQIWIFQIGGQEWRQRETHLETHLKLQLQ